MRLTADLELDVCYYNVKLSVWEPLVEPNLIKEGEYDPWTLKIQVGFHNFKHRYSFPEVIHFDVRFILFEIFFGAPLLWCRSDYDFVCQCVMLFISPVCGAAMTSLCPNIKTLDFVCEWEMDTWKHLEYTFWGLKFIFQGHCRTTIIQFYVVVLLLLLWMHTFHGFLILVKHLPQDL